MRIIGGQWRRRILVAPEGLDTRPMTDRVREAVFETLGSHLGTPGALPPIRVLDVFAGSGVVGLEALSRGATWCAFVEHAGAALKAIRRNIVGLMGDLAKQSTQVLRADAFRPLHWMPLVQQTPVDLVIVDPPYPRSGDASESGPVGRLLAGLSGGELLAKEAVVILRHEARVEYDQHAYGRLRATDVRRYGNMAVTYLALQTARTGGTAIT